MCLWQVPQKQLCYLSVVLQSGLALLAANARVLVAAERHARIKLVPAQNARTPKSVSMCSHRTGTVLDKIPSGLADQPAGNPGMVSNPGANAKAKHALLGPHCDAPAHHAGVLGTTPGVDPDGAGLERA